MISQKPREIIATPNEIQLYESNRISGEKMLSPNEIRGKIKERIFELLKNPPLYDRYQHSHIKNSVTFKIPNDANLFVLFEHMLFEALFEMRKNESLESKIHVDDISLMSIDEITPSLTSTINPGNFPIRGETLSEHESQHAEAQQDIAGGDIYVGIVICEDIINGKTVLYLEGIMLGTLKLSKEEFVEVLLSPRNPSNSDYARVIKNISRLPQKKLFQHLKDEGKINHKIDDEAILGSDDIDPMLVDQWRKMRNLAKII